MPFCTTCGASVAGAFCPQCGTPVSAASAQPVPPAPVPPPPLAMTGMPPGVPAKRKTSPIVWILVIVLGLFVLGGVAVVGTTFFIVHKARQAGIDPDLWRRNPGLAAGKMIAAFNPNLEVLRVNEGSGTITLRDKRTGKETTISFDDAQHGRFHISTEDDNGKQATVDFGGSAANLPSWIPQYPGSNPQVAIAGSGADGAGGSFTFTTSDPQSRVIEFYKDKFKSLGLESGYTETAIGEGAALTGTDDSTRRSLTVTIGASGGQTSVTVLYGQK